MKLYFNYQIVRCLLTNEKGKTKKSIHLRGINISYGSNLIHFPLITLG